MLCPKCNTELRISEREGVETDNCPSCRGVWLDRGELDKIIERSSGRNDDYDDDRRGRRRDHDDDDYDDRDHNKYGGRRKKSFLENLFD